MNFSYKHQYLQRNQFFYNTAFIYNSFFLEPLDINDDFDLISIRQT